MIVISLIVAIIKPKSKVWDEELRLILIVFVDDWSVSCFAVPFLSRSVEPIWLIWTPFSWIKKDLHFRLILARQVYLHQFLANNALLAGPGHPSSMISRMLDLIIFLVDVGLKQSVVEPSLLAVTDIYFRQISFGWLLLDLENTGLIVGRPSISILAVSFPISPWFAVGVRFKNSFWLLASIFLTIIQLKGPHPLYAAFALNIGGSLFVLRRLLLLLVEHVKHIIVYLALFA